MSSHTDAKPVVFDFKSDIADHNGKGGLPESVVTYSEIVSEVQKADALHPLLVLQDEEGILEHHQNGIFTNPHRRTSFEFETDEGSKAADIIRIDSRFIRLVGWLGENHLTVRLHGDQTEKGYAVYRIRTVDPSGRTNIVTADNALLQFAIDRLLHSRPVTIDPEDEEEEESSHLTSLSQMANFLQMAGDTLPKNVSAWAHRNLAVTKNHTVSQEERRHAQRALQMMLNIRWQGAFFEAIDPEEARRILDEELFGMEGVKQRIIETIIQINRTHTLPFYGLLLTGPAGIGKSQVAYAVARILKLPWTSLDMSTIHDSEALTGSPRVYSNAKPGRIMEAFSQAGTSNLVFIINELDKADNTSVNGNPADALLTLLDNLGYTDNYIECMIPTVGVYPIATANDKTRISEPLMTRFAVIDIPDYSMEEKKEIFRRFSMPKILKRLGMHTEECLITEEALDVIAGKSRHVSGVRDLEQDAEHLAAHALYLIETKGLKKVTFDTEKTEQLLGIGRTND
jgi:ATP-dependent Lon protease